MDKKLAIGVDVGGSHVSCMAYDLTNKRITCKYTCRK